MSKRDYYEVLGVKKDSTQDQIKKAYRPHRSYFSKKTGNNIRVWSNSHQQNNQEEDFYQKKIKGEYPKANWSSDKASQSVYLPNVQNLLEYWIRNWRRTYFTLEHSNIVGNKF